MDQSGEDNSKLSDRIRGDTVRVIVKILCGNTKSIASLDVFWKNNSFQKLVR